MCAKADLDRFGLDADRWRNDCITPMQYLLNMMSMIPKKEKGEFRMIAAMALCGCVIPSSEQKGSVRGPLRSHMTKMLSGLAPVACTLWRTGRYSSTPYGP